MCRSLILSDGHDGGRTEETMKKSKICCLALAGILGASMFLAGCGSKGNGDKDTTVLTIYKARPTYMVDGTQDDVVKKAIEDKFYQDTGEKISLNVKLYNDNELTQKVDINWSKKKEDMDAVIHYISEDVGSAIKKYATEKNTVIEVSSLLEKSGKNILSEIRKNDTDHIGERSAYFPYSDGTYAMNAIPSIEQEKGYAMTVRKDWMRQLYNEGHFSCDPELFDTNNDGYRSMTISEFNEYLYAVKRYIPDVHYSIEGAPWTMNWLLASVYDADNYSIMLDENGKYAPAEMNENNAVFLNQLWQWAKDGIWENESASRADSNRETDLLAGFTAVCCTYPQIENVISLQRKFLAANPTGELMVVAPIAKDDGTVNGYMKRLRASSGVILPDKLNSDSEMVVKYIDWLYSDVENYELARYGIKGEHWVEGDDYTLNGKTYKTWVYPDGKEDEFNENPPYSGEYLILENINVSNRLRGDYNTLEKRWYVLATNEFQSYSSNDIEGVWLPTIPRDLKSAYNQMTGPYVESIRSVAWAGLGDKPITELLAEHRPWARTYFPEMLAWYDNSIKASVSYFDRLFKD